MSEAIARQIEGQIFRGQLKPGEVLAPETELMKQFGVGRYTVREALRIIETSGFIKVRQGSQGGSVITRITNDFVSDFLNKAIRFGEVSPFDLSQFRLALEPPIAAIAAAKKDIKQEFLSAMAANVSKVRKLYQKNKVTAYGNMDFHVLLAMATENPMFIILLKTLRAGFNLIIPPKKPDSDRHHCSP